MCKLLDDLFKQTKEDLWEDNLVHVFKYFCFCLVLFKLSLYPYRTHLTSSTEDIPNNCQFLPILLFDHRFDNLTA